MQIKAIVTGLGLAAAIGFAAHAQTAQVSPGPSVASLPPADAGPRASSHLSIPLEGHQAVAKSGAYPGPGPGATNGQMPPHFDKPADWDQNVALHPYTSGQGPKAH